MEQALEVKHDSRGQTISSRAVVRYADDFVVFCESKQDAAAAKQILAAWLAQRGLALSEEKTRIVHLTEGFDFLGFNVKHYKAKNTRTGFKLLIKPSKQSVHNIRRKLKTEWRKLQGTNVAAVVTRLNPIIRGEANYYRRSVASKTFSSLDHWMFQREHRWSKRTHPKKPAYWRKQRYWGRLHPSRNDNWVFGNKQTGQYLLKFAWFKIEYHILVKGTASLDDPTLQAYWAKRNKGEAKSLSAKAQKLARKQKWLCPLCGVTLFNEEELQIHHKKPRSQGGTNEIENLALVHLYCHQQIQIHGGKDAMGEPLLL
jgi:RNA-directed DNA polymerase